MDDYAKTKKLLSNFNMMKVYIENIEKEIEFLKKEDGMKGIDYNGVGGSSDSISNPTADTAIRNIKEIEKLEEIIKENKLKLYKISNTMKKLEKIENIIINEKYINNKQWWQIAGIVKYSERHCKRIRNDAINKMAVGIFGD